MDEHVKRCCVMCGILAEPFDPAVHQQSDQHKIKVLTQSLSQAEAVRDALMEEKKQWEPNHPSLGPSEAELKEAKEKIKGIQGKLAKITKERNKLKEEKKQWEQAEAELKKVEGQNKKMQKKLDQLQDPSTVCILLFLSSLCQLKCSALIAQRI